MVSVLLLNFRQGIPVIKYCGCGCLVRFCGTTLSYWNLHFIGSKFCFVDDSQLPSQRVLSQSVMSTSNSSQSRGHETMKWNIDILIFCRIILLNNAFSSSHSLLFYTAGGLCLTLGSFCPSEILLRRVIFFYPHMQGILGTIYTLNVIWKTLHMLRELYEQ